MQKLNPSELPFSTTDAVLAFCLYSAGVPFHNSRQPLRNEYTREFLIDWLKKRGVKGEVDLFEKAKEAAAAGVRGRIRYIFKRTKELPKLLKWFNDQKAEIDAPGSSVDAAEWQAALMEEVAKGEVKPQEALIRLNCVSLKINVLFRNIYKDLPAHYQIDNPGEPIIMETADGKVVEYPGFRSVSTNCKQATLERLKLI